MSLERQLKSKEGVNSSNLGEIQDQNSKEDKQNFCRKSLLDLIVRYKTLIEESKEKAMDRNSKWDNGLTLHVGPSLHPERCMTQTTHVHVDRL